MNEFITFYSLAVKNRFLNMRQLEAFEYRKLYYFQKEYLFVLRKWTLFFVTFHQNMITFSIAIFHSVASQD